MTGRRGFSLLELIVVMAVLALSAAVVVPRLAAGSALTSTEVAVERLTRLLHSARRTALTRATDVEVRVDPESGRWWTRIDGSGGPGGVRRVGDRSRVVEGRLVLPSAVRLQAASPRLVYRFSREGSAHGDPVSIVGDGTVVEVRVDAWSGEIRVDR